MDEQLALDIQEFIDLSVPEFCDCTNHPETEKVIECTWHRLKREILEKM